MYVSVNMDVEDICFEEEHIERVLNEIRANFQNYFKEFIETSGGVSIDSSQFDKLKGKFRIKSSVIKEKDYSNTYKEIIINSINDFEKDRQDYLKIMDEELLEEYEYDAAVFKSKVLHNDCPIIRKTLANRKAKELDKYRAAFSRADADVMLAVVKRLCAFCNEYCCSYDIQRYEKYDSYQDLELEAIDTEDYTVYGVIGGGIKTHMMYKMYPELFPNRSSSALWALWYLTNKKTFGCNTDSEFLMIDEKKSTTYQNYFYPYALFAYYAYEIYKMLKEKADEVKVYIDPEYRYVIVDAFLSFIAQKYESAISELKRMISDDGGSYYAFT